MQAASLALLRLPSIPFTAQLFTHYTLLPGEDACYSLATHSYPGRTPAIHSLHTPTWGEGPPPKQYQPAFASYRQGVSRVSLHNLFFYILTYSVHFFIS